MARIYKPESYNNSYRAQSVGVGFTPVSPVDETKREREKSNRQIRDLQTLEKALTRQQQLDKGMLEGDFTIQQAELKKQQAANDAKFATLKGVMQLSGLALQAYGKVAEIDTARQEWERESTEFWGQLDNPALDSAQAQPTHADSQTFQSAVIASDKAAQEVAGDNVPLGSELRTEQREAVNARGTRIQTGMNAISSLPVYMREFMRSDTQLRHPVTGKIYTPSTYSTHAELAYAQQQGLARFYRDYNVKGLDGQTQMDLLKSAKQFRQNQLYQLSAELDDNLTKATVLNAEETASKSMANPQANIGDIYRELVSGLVGSGKYKGNPSLASEDAVKHIVEVAEGMGGERGTALLKALQEETRKDGGKLKVLHGKIIQDGLDRIEQGIYSDATREEATQRRAVKEAQTARLKALRTASREEDIERINREYQATLQATGGYDAELEMQKLELNGFNYSEYNIIDLQQRQRDGEVFTNDFLRQEVLDKSITLAEAKTIGFRPDSELSRDEQFASDEGKINLQANAISLSSEVLDEVLQDASVIGGQRDIIKAGDGAVVMDHIKERVIAEFRNRVLDEPNADLTRKKEILQESLQKVRLEAKQITYDTNANKIKLNAFPVETSYKPSVTSLRVHPDGGTFADLSSLTPEQLKKARRAPSRDLILTPSEFKAAHSARINNTQPPQAVIDKAEAQGLSWEGLYKAQARAYRQPEKIAEEATPYTIKSSTGNVTLDRLRIAIIGKESGGQFGVVNPDSGALGYGQVMPENLPSWSKAALGRSLTPREFLRNPELQIKIINHRMKQTLMQLQAAGYSGDTLIRRFAAIWYSGNGDLMNSTRPQYSNGRQYPSIHDYTMDILRRVKSGG